MVHSDREQRYVPRRWLSNVPRMTWNAATVANVVDLATELDTAVPAERLLRVAERRALQPPDAPLTKWVNPLDRIKTFQSQRHQSQGAAPTQATIDG